MRLSSSSPLTGEACLRSLWGSLGSLGSRETWLFSWRVLSCASYVGERLTRPAALGEEDVFRGDLSALQSLDLVFPVAPASEVVFADAFCLLPDLR